jgi:hypothetical protein
MIGPVCRIVIVMVVPIVLVQVTTASTSGTAYDGSFAAACQTSN